jgi:hypothetical protein
MEPENDGPAPEPVDHDEPNGHEAGPPLTEAEAALAAERNLDATERRAHESVELAEHVAAAADDLAARRAALTGEPFGRPETVVDPG